MGWKNYVDEQIFPVMRSRSIATICAFTFILAVLLISSPWCSIESALRLTIYCAVGVSFPASIIAYFALFPDVGLPDCRYYMREEKKFEFTTFNILASSLLPKWGKTLF